MIKTILIQFLSAIFLVSIAQASELQQFDLLMNKVSLEKSNDKKLDLLLDAARKYNKDIQYLTQCEEILQHAVIIASQDSNLNGLSKVYNSYGVLYRNIAQYEKALDYHQKAVNFAIKADSQTLLASAYNGIGVVYRRMDNHPKATLFHLQGLKAAEQASDTFNISVSINSLGNIYSLNGQYNEALSYFQRALKLSRYMNNRLGQAINYNNIGEVYEFMGVLDSAMIYYSKSFEANIEINSEKGIAISYNAIGKIHLLNGRVNEAYNLFKQALEIDLKLGDKKFIADSYINLSRAYLAMNKLYRAELASNKGLDIAKEIGSIIHTQWAFENLSEIYLKRNRPDTALVLYKKASLFKDSLLNEKNARAIAMTEVMFDTEKKEQEIQILLQKQEINKKELARQKTIRNFYLVGFIFALSLAISVMFALNIKRKANLVLAQQRDEIVKSHELLSIQQKEIIEQKQEIENHRNSIEQKNRYLEDAYKVIEGYISKITDSIRYAERIQSAILPPLTISEKFFRDNYAFYKPKDFVSGDFYWLTVKDDTLFVAVADCTGHGVPGAFMSIIGIDLLSQAVNQKNIIEPASILDFLNIELRNKLRKEESEELILKDSMDVAVVSLKLGDNKIRYSGALIPLTIIRNKKIIEFKPDFRSIGTSVKVFDRPFKQETIDIIPNDWIYLYTDGFIDQFGGDEYKKYSRSQFFKTLISNSASSGQAQRNELHTAFTGWRGNGEQIDDVLVLGLKV